MKKLIMLVLVCLFALTGLCYAATPQVSADSKRFEPLQMKYYLEGNVRVQLSDILITADKAQVELLRLLVTGQGHIHLVQAGKIDFTGDNVEVLGAENTAYITGKLRFKQGDLLITADKGDFNWQTKIAHFSGNVVKTTGEESEKLSKLTYNVITKRFL